MSTTDATVVAVTGEVPATSLGAVLPHEHLLSDFAPPDDTPESWARTGRTRPTAAGALWLYRAPLTMDLLGEVGMGAVNRDDLLLGDAGLAAAELAAFREAGGGTVVDLTADGLGRDPAGLRRLAEETGVTVVMGCGRHHPARPAHPAALAAPAAPAAPAAREAAAPTSARDVAALTSARDVAALAGELTEELVRELTEGVRGVRAGIIGELAALDPGVPAERAFLVAAARASAATGAAVSLARNDDPAVQQRVLDVLAEEGTDLTRVAVGHCDALSPRPDDLEPLLGRGVFVQFDRLGRLPTALSVSDDQDVAAAVLELARRGHAGRLLLSQGVRAKSELLAYGGGGYAFVLRQFVPYLRMLGADDELIETLTVRNPRRLLALRSEEAGS
ncbi:phosphotriesterase [Nonomuraea sp. NPDC049646]|uniref:phosphotriesterase family protein n=1 Tax=unclassified Nonomuraea TaxID=2593643 RepID=UPI0037B2691F